MNNNEILEKISELAHILDANVYCGSGINEMEFYIPTIEEVRSDNVYQVDKNIHQFYITLVNKDGGFTAEDFLKDNLDGQYDLFLKAVNIYGDCYSFEYINNFDKLDMLIEKAKLFIK